MKAISEIAEQEERQKEKIIKIAYDIVTHHQELKIRDLASTANVYVPLIYKLFGSKSGLMKEITIKISEEILQHLQMQLDKHEDTFLKLTQYGVNYINLAIKKPQLYTFLTAFRSLIHDKYVEDFCESYNLTLKKALQLLRTLVNQLYTDAYNGKREKGSDTIIENCVVELWSHVHGLGMLAMNKDWINANFTSHIENRIIDTFANMRNILTDKLQPKKNFEKAIDIINTLELE